jgi:hypothetical protein
MGREFQSFNARGHLAKCGKRAPHRSTDRKTRAVAAGHDLRSKHSDFNDLWKGGGE